MDRLDHAVSLLFPAQGRERIARIEDDLVSRMKLRKAALLLMDITEHERTRIQSLFHAGKRPVEIDRIVMRMAEHTVFHRHCSGHTGGMDQVGKARCKFARTGAWHKATITVGDIPAHLRQPAEAMHIVHVDLFDEEILTLPIECAGRFTRFGRAQLIHHAGFLNFGPLAEIGHTHPVWRKALDFSCPGKGALQDTVAPGNPRIGIIADDRPAIVLILLSPIGACPPQAFPARPENATPARDREGECPGDIEIRVVGQSLFSKAGHRHLADGRHGEVPGKIPQHDPFGAHDRQRHKIAVHQEKRAIPIQG